MGIAGRGWEWITWAPVDQSGAVMWSRERSMAWESGMGGWDGRRWEELVRRPDAWDLMVGWTGLVGQRRTIDPGTMRV